MKRDVFQAVADPTRRKILSLLSKESKTPNELAEHFNISRQAVSKHIKILYESGLLEQEHSGRKIFYKLNPARMKVIDNWIEQFRLMLEDRFNELDKLLSKKNKKE